MTRASEAIVEEATGGLVFNKFPNWSAFVRWVNQSPQTSDRGCLPGKSQDCRASVPQQPSTVTVSIVSYKKMTASLSTIQKKCIEDFIEIYKSEPCLWKMNSTEYRDRDLKNTAYLKLVNKLKEIEPSSTKKSVVTRINSMRSNYRKELKKLKASMRTGSGANEVYKPTLWYFNDLNFLDDQETPRNSRSNIESDDDETWIEVSKIK